jgi:hypothetical protein
MWPTFRAVKTATNRLPAARRAGGYTPTAQVKIIAPPDSYGPFSWPQNDKRPHRRADRQAGRILGTKKAPAARVGLSGGGVNFWSETLRGRRFTQYDGNIAFQIAHVLAVFVTEVGKFRFGDKAARSVELDVVDLLAQAS